MVAKYRPPFNPPDARLWRTLLSVFGWNLGLSGKTEFKPVNGEELIIHGREVTKEMMDFLYEMTTPGASAPVVTETPKPIKTGDLFSDKGANDKKKGQ
jgi:hypothetical protein